MLLALTIGVASNTAAGGRKVLDATMTGLPVPGTVIAGITGAGAPWVIDEGKAQLFADGRIHVVVEGLVIPGRVPPLPPNPVAMGKAVVSCNGVFADDTALVPFSPRGRCGRRRRRHAPGAVPGRHRVLHEPRWRLVRGDRLLIEG